MVPLISIFWSLRVTWFSCNKVKWKDAYNTWFRVSAHWTVPGILNGAWCSISWTCNRPQQTEPLMRQWYQCLLSVTRGDNFHLLEIMVPSVETDRKKHETAGFLWVWKLHESRGHVCLLFHCILCAWNIICWTYLFFLRVNEQINELQLYPCFPTNKWLDCKIWPSPLEQASPNSIRI